MQDPLYTEHRYLHHAFYNIISVPTATPQRKKYLHFTAEKTNAQEDLSLNLFLFSAVFQFSSVPPRLTLLGNYSFTHLTPEAIFEAVYTAGTQ